MKNILVQYSKLSPISLNFVYAEEFLPSPSKSDYDEGVITRYFVRKVNDPAIIEVDLANYESVSSALYSRVDLEWVISGPKNNVYFEGKIQLSGASEKNAKSVTAAAKSMNGIENKLINFSQFFRSK
jgi:hypothetical protein